MRVVSPTTRLSIAPCHKAVTFQSFIAPDFPGKPFNPGGPGGPGIFPGSPFTPRAHMYNMTVGIHICQKDRVR